MSGDDYLKSILNRERVDTGAKSQVRNVLNVAIPFLKDWAGWTLIDASPSGSFAKGTAIRSGTDIDIFISLRNELTIPLKEIYENLYQRLLLENVTPRKQNVSIGSRIFGYKVDFVPAKSQGNMNYDHSIYRSRAQTWTKTNVHTHITTVINAGCADEIMILKVWRSQHDLTFPSFYLELMVIEALKQVRTTSLANNVFHTLKYIGLNIMTKRIIDPANTANIISDDLTNAEKQAIKNAALLSSSQASWGEIVK